MRPVASTIDGRWYSDDGTLRGVRVAHDGGRITAVDTGPADPALPLVAPGFVDLQVNGIDDVDVRSATGGDWDRIGRSNAAGGTTAWCPTLVTASLESYAAPLASMGTALGRPGLPRVLGAHLEGPFLGGAPGAHDPSRIIAADLDWLAALPDHVALVTLAPECPGAVDATRLLRDRGVAVSMGHSTATDDEIEAAVSAGATMATHLFNGMAPIHHRRPGLAGAVLADDRVTTSVIADGVHVDLRWVRTTFAAKGAERMVLVTDAVAWQAPGLADLGIGIVDGGVRLPDGTLAGSSLTMLRAVANAIGAGVAPHAAITAATRTPARIVGHGGGRLEVGAPADLVRIDDDAWAVRDTIVGGEVVFSA